MKARSKGDTRAQRRRHLARQTDKLDLQRDLVKRLESEVRRLEAFTFPHPEPTVPPDTTYIAETLNRIEVQNKGILNLIRMLFKLMKEPENLHHNEAVRRDTIGQNPSPWIPRKEKME